MEEQQLREILFADPLTAAVQDALGGIFVTEVLLLPLQLVNKRKLN